MRHTIRRKYFVRSNFDTEIFCHSCTEVYGYKKLPAGGLFDQSRLSEPTHKPFLEFFDIHMYLQFSTCTIIFRKILSPRPERPRCRGKGKKITRSAKNFDRQIALDSHRWLQFTGKKKKKKESRRACAREFLQFFKTKKEEKKYAARVCVGTFPVLYKGFLPFSRRACARKFSRFSRRFARSRRRVLSSVRRKRARVCVL